MPQITKQYKFCAAHKYWNNDWSAEKNKQIFDDDIKIHGHNYDLYITIKGPINRDSGFIINLLDLNQLVKKEVINELDHSMIHEHPWFLNKQPSTENLVMFIWEKISTKIQIPAKLHCVKLRETGTIFTEYYGDK